MQMPLKIFPEWTVKQYGLKDKADQGWVYWGIEKAIYGLPQADLFANHN